MAKKIQNYINGKKISGSQAEVQPSKCGKIDPGWGENDVFKHPRRKNKGHYGQHHNRHDRPDNVPPQLLEVVEE